jgi:CRISPR-associated endonuclease Cas2
VQYSVFECDISDEQRQKLENLLKKAIHPVEDDIRFYPLNAADIRRVRLLGKAKLERERGYYLV